MSEQLGTDAGSAPPTADGGDGGALGAPPKCWGCQKAIDGGSAIQFADGVWHIDCFQCTTCSKIIEFDSNLLFLADGKPICPECSYCCSLCKKPIFDEAIVTVEGTYHSECFRCTNCKQRIQGKSFAKTSQGVIYCVTCYAERRERKKAAKRRREHQQIGEEKMLPSLPVEAEAAAQAAAAQAAESASNTLSPSSVAPSPPPDESLLPRYAGGQQQQSDLRSRRRGMHTSGEFSGGAAAGSTTELTLTQAIEMIDEPSSGAKDNGNKDAGGSGLTLFPVGSSAESRGGSPTALRPYEPASSLASATAASAPTSPTRDNNYASYRPQGLTLAPITPLHASLSADPIFDLKLAWTEDISSLENNYVRYSMRTPLVAKQTPDVPGSAVSNRSTGFHQSPRRETVAGTATAVQDDDDVHGRSVAAGVGATSTGSPLLRVASGNRSPALQRARAASSASALSNFVPPGLRSSGRDASADSGERVSPVSSLQALQMPRPSPLAATTDSDPDGKEWLNTASVEQLKEELLVNYGQYCRMEASYQKLKDLYASVIDQLLETRESLHQERSKRIEFENVLRTYHGHAPLDPSAAAGEQLVQAKNPAAAAAAAGGAQRTRNGFGASAGATDRVDSQQRSTGAAKHHNSSRGNISKPGSGQASSVARQPSLRRQRQARKQDASGADHNDSGSDADDAIITTVPQKATKRFIWPFGSSSHHDHAATAGAGVVAGGKNSIDGSMQHSFHLASTFRAGKCDHCQERLKTFTNSVVRCRNCGFVCHQRCANEVTAACSSGESGVGGGAVGGGAGVTAAVAGAVSAAGGRAGRGANAAQGSFAGGQAGNDSALVYDPNVPFLADKMFGRALAEQTALEGRSVPWVVRAAIEFIEAEGLTMEGVYRRSGSTMDIRAVQMEITRVATATNNRFGDEPAIAPSDTDVTSVTSVLKQYFRDLPNPLMTSETYHLWVQASNIASSEERVKVYRTISDSMPVPHSETLRYLMTHLKRVADHHQDNKMTPNNLSVVFAPNILHMGKNDVLQEMANMSGISRTVSFLIQNAEDIWGPHRVETSGEVAKSEPAEAQQQFARPPMRRLKDMNMLTVNAISSPGPSSVQHPALPLDIGGTVEGLGHALENSSLSQSMPSPKELYFGDNAVPDRLASHHQRNINNSSGVYHKSSFDMPRGNK
ncbi:Rho-type gtpase-activating protein [Coemansia sp. RSA 455]|nr:Rho-type gtpase-activating protein [Coemansia sp. S16]KAJ2254193.1 Rho-type gtpase-activating protein [Coemansia sp. RSA 455]